MVTTVVSGWIRDQKVETRRTVKMTVMTVCQTLATLSYASQGTRRIKTDDEGKTEAIDFNDADRDQGDEAVSPYTFKFGLPDTACAKSVGGEDFTEDSQAHYKQTDGQTLSVMEDCMSLPSSDRGHACTPSSL